MLLRKTIYSLISLIMIIALSACGQGSKASEAAIAPAEAWANQQADGAQSYRNPKTHRNAKNLKTPKNPKTPQKQTSSLSAIVTLPSEIPSQIIERTGFTASYNRDTRCPNWVAWHLTRDHTSGPYKRQGKAFHEDESVPTPRATDDDYRRSGYDRGHMCPAGDNHWSAQAMEDCFLFTNMCPQNSELNRGDWNEIEMACRRWAQQYGEVYIVCGPIFFKSGQKKTIGRNKVRVPDAFFKVVYCHSAKKPWTRGYICRNTDGNRNRDFYENTLQQVERITGYKFNFEKVKK